MNLREIYNQLSLISSYKWLCFVVYDFHITAILTSLIKVTIQLLCELFEDVVRPLYAPCILNLSRRLYHLSKWLWNVSFRKSYHSQLWRAIRFFICYRYSGEINGSQIKCLESLGCFHALDHSLISSLVIRILSFKCVAQSSRRNQWITVVM